MKLLINVKIYKARQNIQLKLQKSQMSVQLSRGSCQLSQSNASEQSQVAGFVFKTFEILGIEQYQKIIYWAPNGLEFVIKDVVKFEEIVLPRFFRHNKMNSFVRQLNMYGFHKIKHNSFKSTFRHQFFQKDKEELLPMIRRKPKLNDKQNQEITEQIKVPLPSKPERCIVQSMKQQQPTMAHEKWANISQQFLFTTKMINMSLIKVSYNELAEIANLIPQEQNDCVSIEDQLEHEEQQEQDLCQFQDPACFFASRFNL